MAERSALEVGDVIIDGVKRLGMLAGVPRAKEIAAWLAATDVDSVPDGDHPIDGTGLFARVLRYEPADPSVGSFETHRLYCDVQVVIRGTDRIDTVPAGDLVPAGDYSETGDFRFFTAAPTRVSTLVLPAGTFATFEPGEAHRPGLAYVTGAERVLKVVFKVRTA